MKWGNKNKYGLGETLGEIICDRQISEMVFSSRKNKSISFLYPEISISANAYKYNIPFTIHTGIGTDIVDQHSTFDGEAKGGCSGRDFLIFAEEVTKLSNGGVFLNIGSAITGPEVLLKSVSMASNIGKPPRGIITANFDLKEYKDTEKIDESNQYYYFRDLKSILNRIPKAYGGTGSYIHGNHKDTIPILYKELIKRIK